MDPPGKAWNKKVQVERAVAPDGGYAWFILVSCFFVFGLTFGVVKSFGVFYVEIQQYFGTTAAGTSWITSIAVATIHVAAPLASALSSRYSHRSVVIAGGLICSVGAILGSFGNNLVQLYLTVGFLNGFGYALTWTPTVTMLGMYFDKRRPMANALASAGECILTFILTPMFQLLINSFSWRGALLIMGALQLNLCVCGLLLRPLKSTRDKELYTEESNQETSKKYSTSLRERDLRTKVQQYVDYTLITNPRFMIYSMFGVFAALGFFAPSLFLVPYARSKGIEEYQAAALIVVFATVVFLGAVLLLCPLASTFYELVAFSAAHGLVYGATVAIHITVLPEVVGVQRLGSALGFFMLIRSSGGLLGPPIAGFFIDKMDSYGTGFLMSGVALLTSALFLLVLNLMMQKDQRKKNIFSDMETEELGQSFTV
uniref:Monocarboxylate transporter 13 n=1 Tax=Oryzias latipes TaxID=8090 RepID=A0A3P9H156_ORYLA